LAGAGDAEDAAPEEEALEEPHAASAPAVISSRAVRLMRQPYSRTRTPVGLAK
jgi:hypothetical protein